jgi:hypothetical protein
MTRSLSAKPEDRDDVRLQIGVGVLSKDGSYSDQEGVGDFALMASHKMSLLEAEFLLPGNCWMELVSKERTQ